MRKILVEKDICVRGLAHPVVTSAGIGGFMEKIKEQQEEADENQVQTPNKTTRLGLPRLPAVLTPRTMRSHRAFTDGREV